MQDSHNLMQVRALKWRLWKACSHPAACICGPLPSVSEGTADTGDGVMKETPRPNGFSCLPYSLFYGDSPRHDRPSRTGRGDGVLLPWQRLPFLLPRNPVVVPADS